MTMPTGLIECLCMMQVIGYVDVPIFIKLKLNRRINMWTKPAATEMRFGFEVTMYVCNR